MPVVVFSVFEALEIQALKSLALHQEELTAKNTMWLTAKHSSLAQEQNSRMCSACSWALCDVHSTKQTPGESLNTELSDFGPTDPV